MSAESAANVESVADNTGLAVLSLVRDYGVDTVFGIPGTHNLEFYRHLAPLGMRAVTARHEQGAGYMAGGWSQRTRLPGVVITTSGPGLLNALSAAGTAYCESRPMIILSPGPARGEEFADIGSLHETKDQLGAASAVVEWGRRVRTAQEAVDAVHDAFELFRYSRPRPVYIEVPLDLLEGPAEVDAESRMARPLRKSPSADETEIGAAARLLHAARRPVILAGGGSVDAGDALRRVAERLGAPVATTLNGKGALSERHPLSLGADLRLEAVRRAVNDSDALLIVGSKVGPAELWGGVIAPRGAVIRVDIAEAQIHKNVRADAALVGDARTVLEQLEAALEAGAPLPDGADPGDSDAREPWCDVAAVRRDAVAESSAFAELEDRIAARIAAVLPDDAIVTGDSSQITYYGMSSRVRSTAPNAFLYMAAYATLGFGLPAGIGARIASPELPVVSVLGDGALMFSVQELQTAAEQGIDLLIVCVDNGGYGEILQNESDRGIPPVGVRLMQPDWPALAEAFGGRGYAIRASEDLEAVLQDALEAPGVRLVHLDLAAFEQGSG